MRDWKFWALVLVDMALRALFVAGIVGSVFFELALWEIVSREAEALAPTLMLTVLLVAALSVAATFVKEVWFSRKYLRRKKRDAESVEFYSTLNY